MLTWPNAFCCRISRNSAFPKFWSRTTPSTSFVWRFLGRMSRGFLQNLQQNGWKATQELAKFARRGGPWWCWFLAGTSCAGTAGILRQSEIRTAPSAGNMSRVPPTASSSTECLVIALLCWTCFRRCWFKLPLFLNDMSARTQRLCCAQSHLQSAENKKRCCAFFHPPTASGVPESRSLVSSWFQMTSSGIRALQADQK